MRRNLTLRIFIYCASFFLSSSPLIPLSAQTIAEKKASIIVTSDDLSPEMSKLLLQVNSDIRAAHTELESLYREVELLYSESATEEQYAPLHLRINELKGDIDNLESHWRKAAAANGKGAEYSLWYQPETTIGQLVNDYGSQNFLYVSTGQIAKMPISVDSNLPIPQASWDEVLRLILLQSGIGIRQLNSFVRELYLLEGDRSNISAITNRRDDLDLYPQKTQVAFVLSPEPSEVGRIWHFLERFINSNTTALQIIGRDIVVIASISEVRDLLKIYDFAVTHRGDREFKTIAVRKVDVDEMAHILEAIFDIGAATSRPKVQAPRLSEQTSPTSPPRRSGQREGGANIATLTAKRSQPLTTQQEGSGSIKIIPLKNVAQAIFLVGTREEIRKAEEIIQQVEGQIGEAREKSIFWYTAKHSDPEELAQLLQKIYSLMVTTSTGRQLGPEELVEKAKGQPSAGEQPTALAPAPAPLSPVDPYFVPATAAGIYDQGYYLTDRFIAGADRYEKPKPSPNQGRDNFIVDIKTGAIVMVVEVDLLPKIKELIKKLDVPKKMVQIEVMLFEKVIVNNNNIGLNLLQMGALASNSNRASFTHGARSEARAQAATLSIAPLFFDLIPIPGITEFIVSHKKSSGIPAYDAFYNFLISRDDIQINATPSILTVNQTEAVIEVEEEISVNTGTFVIDTAGSPTLNNSFARARYGIKIIVTPTVHMSDKPFDDSELNYITLDSEIKFETFASDINNRPNVTRRTVNNEARIADGQTVIIGGLRRKDSEDRHSSIPFLGEIPGIGKLFSQNTQRDRSTEMFIFMTPKIISEPAEQLECIKAEELNRRPGDIPSFLCALVEARETERHRLYQGTMTMLFGREPGRCVDDEGCPYGCQ